jgi:poly(hydroxyalkanoate) depolymerase family esterase
MKNLVVRHAVLASLTLATAACAGASPTPGGAPERDAVVSSAVSTLAQVSSFGTNPGNLLMFTYAPAGVPAHAPVVFALHGCSQTASQFEDVGWNDAADRDGFYVVYPQQQSSNNTETCFNWFGNTSGSTADITRGQGEAASIKEMVDYMQATYGIDTSRVYVSGFSAGAAYAVALLALYPDVFAAGASFSGVPFGCATSLSTAYTCMYSSSSNTGSQWATLVKNAYPGYTGKYPRISVWQGSQDTTVATANLGEIVAQWTAVLNASTTATSTATDGNASVSRYADSNGVVQVESYSVSGMGHAVAIDGSAKCGSADTYAVSEGVCATDRAAQFFGLEAATGGTSSGSTSSSGSGGSSGIVGGTSSGGGPIGGASSGAASSSGAAGASSGGASSGAAADGSAPADLPGCSAAPGGHGRSSAAWVLVALGALLVARRRRGLATAVTLLALTALPSVARAAGENPDIELDPIDAPKAEAHRNPDKALSKPAILGPQGAFYTGAAVSTTPAALFGFFPLDHLATTVGLGFTYNGNGAPTSPLTAVKGAPNNRVGSDLMLDVMYFVHDVAPFAMGPELNFLTSLSPNYPATVIVVTPMWALRYAPWRAPIAIGTGIGMSFAFTRGAQPVASLSTQGLDIVYAF